MNNKLKKNFYILTSTCLVSGLLLSGCMNQPNLSYNDETKNQTKDPLSSFVNNLNTENKDEIKSSSSQTDNLILAQQVLDASVEEIPTLTAVGYAVVSTQPGRSDAQKRLMAIRAARMAAMRDLAEQIHGLQVDSNTTVVDLMVQNDTFRGVVTGTIRGARTVRINPTGADTYEIVLEIDREMMTYLLSVARQA
jgi:outer membrane murein-binding lipoprotein Lpp|tara:strand:+ start:3093 stop:3674 length:582 start_codon:yes stop_codon:yes gene_type:complete